jgi:hypothetical protein
VANPHHYSKLFLGAFDGHSEDMARLTIGQRYVWLALLAFARAQEPHGMLNTGTRDDDPIPASLRRLARWAQVSVSTIKEAIDRFSQLGMLKQDGRRRTPCWEIANWAKWQVHHGLDECSAGEQEGVRQANTDCGKCSAGEHQRSATEHQCSAGEHLSDGGWCSVGEHGQPGSQGAQVIAKAYDGLDECSVGERTIENRVSENDSPSPSPSPVPNDEEEGTGLSSRQTTRARFDAALADVGGAEREGQQMDALYEQCRQIAGDHAEAVLPVAAGNTAQWAFEQGRRGKRPRWVQVTAYLVKVCRSLADDEQARDDAMTAPEKLYVRLVGPKPTDTYMAQRTWEMEKREFCDDAEGYLLSKCGTGRSPRLQARAVELGLWDDDLPERVRARILARARAQEASA